MLRFSLDLRADDSSPRSPARTDDCPPRESAARRTRRGAVLRAPRGTRLRRGRISRDRGRRAVARRARSVTRLPLAHRKTFSRRRDAPSLESIGLRSPHASGPGAHRRESRRGPRPRSVRGRGVVLAPSRPAGGVSLRRQSRRPEHHACAEVPLRCVRRDRRAGRTSSTIRATQPMTRRPGGSPAGSVFRSPPCRRSR